MEEEDIKDKLLKLVGENSVLREHINQKNYELVFVQFAKQKNRSALGEVLKLIETKVSIENILSYNNFEICREAVKNSDKDLLILLVRLTNHIPDTQIRMFKASYDEVIAGAEEESKVYIINSSQNKEQAYAVINTVMNIGKKITISSEKLIEEWRESKEKITENVRGVIDELVCDKPIFDETQFVDLSKYSKEVKDDKYLRSFLFFKFIKIEFVLKAREKLYNLLKEVYKVVRQIECETEIASCKKEIEEELARLKIQEEAQKKQETNSLLETNEESYLSPASNSVLAQEELLLGYGPYEVDNLEINEI